MFFQKKYLKYKNKYLNLKNQQGGRTNDLNSVINYDDDFIQRVNLWLNNNLISSYNNVRPREIRSFLRDNNNINKESLINYLRNNNYITENTYNIINNQNYDLYLLIFGNDKMPIIEDWIYSISQPITINDFNLFLNNNNDINRQFLLDYLSRINITFN